MALHQTKMALHQTTNTLHPHQQMISSSAGALLVSMFTTPFEVVKVRLQAQLKPQRIKCFVVNEFVETSCFCVPHVSTYNSPVMCTIYGNIRTVPRFTSTHDAFVKIARLEGVRKLWKGLAPTLVQSVPQTVVYFTAYDQLKVRLGFVPGESNVVPSLTAGTLARTLAVVVVSPLEMARTKFQSKRNLKYNELVSLLYHSVKREGFLSMWRGITPTILRDVPFSALYWVNYEIIKSFHDNPDVKVTFYAGALSGMVAAFFTHPFDLVKTFRQMELGDKLKTTTTTTTTSTSSSTGLAHVVTHLYRTQGMSSLFTGLVPRLAKVAPACAIMISTYEYGKKYFASLNIDDL